VEDPRLDDSVHFSHDDHLDAWDRLVVAILGDHGNSFDHRGGCHQGVEHRDPPLARSQVGHDPSEGAGDLGIDWQGIPGGLDGRKGGEALRPVFVCREQNSDRQFREGDDRHFRLVNASGFSPGPAGRRCHKE
jgi:hypothetical protein